MVQNEVVPGKCKPVTLRGDGISLLVPFRSDNGRRAETWNWLERYWAHELPGAELVIGTDNHPAFSKTSAVNQAAAKANGDIFVILDADCYISGDVVLNCAQNIRSEKARGHALWYMPYRNFYRLTDTASRVVLNSDPTLPPRFFAAAPAAIHTQNQLGSVNGHHFGALIQLMPREAFEITGGMDTRFYGWGGEDVAFMHAVDTLYVKHKTSDNGVIHLWHPSIGDSVLNRMWEGQEKPGNNGNLAGRYFAANGNRAAMLRLVTEKR